MSTSGSGSGSGGSGSGIGVSTDSTADTTVVSLREIVGMVNDSALQLIIVAVDESPCSLYVPTRQAFAVCEAAARVIEC
jgi:hypothetical protein